MEEIVLRKSDIGRLGCLGRSRLGSHPVEQRPLLDITNVLATVMSRAGQESASLHPVAFREVRLRNAQSPVYVYNHPMADTDEPVAGT